MRSEIRNPKGWLQAFIGLLLASVILEVAEILYGKIFSTEFKVFIFYVPTCLCLLIYLTLKFTGSEG